MDCNVHWDRVLTWTASSVMPNFANPMARSRCPNPLRTHPISTKGELPALAHNPHIIITHEPGPTKHSLEDSSQQLHIRLYIHSILENKRHNNQSHTGLHSNSVEDEEIVRVFLQAVADVQTLRGCSWIRWNADGVWLRCPICLYHREYISFRWGRGFQCG